MIFPLFCLTLPKYFSSFFFSDTFFVLTLRRENYLQEVISIFLKQTNCSFLQLLDVWAIDFPYDRENRFSLNYKLVSLKYNFTMYLRFSINKLSLVPTLSHLVSSANWLERECWDLFGIYFEGHSDLRRILTDYGFNGYPLRKDFPLSGYSEVRYSVDFRKVVLEPLDMVQEFRLYDFLSPWDMVV